MRLSSRRGTRGDSPSAESSHRPLCRKRRRIGHPSRGRAEGARAQGSGRARKEDSRSSGHVGVSCRGWRVLDWGGLKELRRQGDGMGVRVFGVESMRCLVVRQDQRVCCRRVELAPLDWVKLLRRIFPAFWRSPCIYVFIHLTTRLREMVEASNLPLDLFTTNSPAKHPPWCANRYPAPGLSIMNNFGVIELAGAKTTSAPGWAYVPDTAIAPGSAGIQPVNRKRARNPTGGGPSLSDLTARQENKIRKEVEALGKDGSRDNTIPLPAKSGRSTY